MIIETSILRFFIDGKFLYSGDTCFNPLLNEKNFYPCLNAALRRRICTKVRHP